MSQDPTRITSFPHLEMTPEDIQNLHDRRKDVDDPHYQEGMAWARRHNLESPEPWDGKDLHDEYICVHRRIHNEAQRRYPDDVVAENRFRDGAKAWAGNE